MSGIIINPYVYAATGLDQIVNNYSMDFDGVDDYVNGGNISALNALGEASWAGWFKMDDTGGNYLMTTWSTVNAEKQILIDQTSTNIVVYMYNPSDVQKSQCKVLWGVDGVPAFSIDQWYHIVVTYKDLGVNDIDTVKIYINGIKGTNDWGVGFTLPVTNTVSSNFEIGKAGGFTTREFNGQIDEVAVFDYELSASDINDIYNATDTNLTADLSSMSTPPIAWYRMGD